jgi:hypothetical protein
MPYSHASYNAYEARTNNILQTEGNSTAYIAEMTNYSKKGD